MASTGQFQLFPPPASKKRRESNPFRRGGTNALRVNPISTIVEDGPTDGSNGHERVKSSEGVVIHIFKEMTPTVQEPPRVYLASSRPVSPILESREEDAISLKSLPGPPKGPPPIRTMPSLSPNPNVDSPSGRRSPVVPIRSMFPKYDPSLALTQQPYYTPRVQSPHTPPERPISRDQYSPSISSVSRIDEIVGCPKTAPASVLNFPLDVLDVKSPRITTISELGTLWEATNGQGPEIATDTFNLRLSRTAEASFSFGSAPAVPFYTLETFANNEIFISRTHPSRPKVNIPILQLNLEPPMQSNSPPMGSTANLISTTKTREMVTYLFPKLAAMLAIEQSDSLAAQHQLAPTIRTQMQGEAVARAAAQEASRLYWNERERRYELEHPAIGKEQPKSPGLVIQTGAQSSASPSSERPVLYITVQDVENDSPSNPTCYPTIVITDPNQRPSSPGLSDHSLPARASTLPLPDRTNDTLPPPLASLSFRPDGPILNIDSDTITRQLPSLYAIDSLVSALFAVAVADSVTNAIMADIEIYDPLAAYKRHLPMPKPAYAGSVAGASTIGGRSYTGSVLYATVAEREEAEEEARSMRQLHSRDVKGRSKSIAGFSLKSFAAMTALNEDPEKDIELAPSSASIKSGKKKKRKTQKVTIQEFDLEKYGTYQSGSREGQKLPGPTRAVLHVMFVVLRFIVWILTLFVSVTAKVLVGGTRVVTSERF